MPKEQEVREILKRFRKEGWEEESGKGSHVLFRKDGVTISVPTSRKEVKLGTYRSIAKAAGWMQATPRKDV
ncbi:type II toxin-antitoxin system HicA family toxin [uncultured Slackia sp.]|uniref:type II toxin-antitoxin system HicA family toxin n=1 Tax=uncultured Slackia sp. TaxID=665903 RepID=UPI0025E5CB9D|nr:type II toxin-antitoxin system HicA family toxin [uncultured Slackia sp.]